MDISRKNLNYDEQAIFALRDLYSRFGYQRYKMSRFEEYDLYVQSKDFLVSDEVITFTDRSGRLLAMKPDVTLSIIKTAPDEAGLVQKVYYNENVYRTDGNHTFREIMQSGLECIGDLTDYDIAEVVLLAAKSLALISERFVLDLSHMGLIAALLEESGLSPAGKTAAYVCLRQKNTHELLALCAKENADAAKLTVLAECSGSASDVLARIRPLMTTPEALGAWVQLEILCSLLDRFGLSDSVRLDFSVGNDLKYYSGVVFRGYIEGIPTGVLSGGQYDALLRKMGRKRSAIGFALYTDLLERLQKTVSDYDIDTVVLHNNADPVALMAAVAALNCDSTLVTTAIPRDKTWRRLIKFENGEVMTLEDNG